MQPPRDPGEELLHVRIGNGTREIAAAEERQKYLAGRWGQ